MDYLTKALGVLVCIALLSLASNPTVCAETSAPKQAPRPKIGLVLKGGGALGFAHVGVLRVLEANHIPVHRIAGTSMGSIVGAAYASGATLEEMEHTLSTTDWVAFF